MLVWLVDGMVFGMLNFFLMCICVMVDGWVVGFCLCFGFYVSNCMCIHNFGDYPPVCGAEPFRHPIKMSVCERTTVVHLICASHLTLCLCIIYIFYLFLDRIFVRFTGEL